MGETSEKMTIADFFVKIGEQADHIESLQRENEQLAAAYKAQNEHVEMLRKEIRDLESDVIRLGRIAERSLKVPS